MIKKLLLGLLIASSAAHAQFAPNQVLRATELNAALAHPTITGGSINGAPIGNTTPSTGVFTTLVASTITGTVTMTVGTATLALTANALTTPRAINGVAFDGTAPITVPAAAGTLTGTTLASNVVNASINAITPTGGTLTTTGTVTAVTGAFHLDNAWPLSWGDNSTYITGNAASDTIGLVTAGSTNLSVSTSGVSVAGSTDSSDSFRTLNTKGLQVKDFAGTYRWAVYGTAGNDLILGDTAGWDSILLQPGGATVATVNSTSFAVTGAISATGQLRAESGSSNAYLFADGTSSRLTLFRSGVESWDVAVVDATGGVNTTLAGTGIITRVTNTGLAVTGALSATNIISTTVEGEAFRSVGATTNARGVRLQNTGADAYFGIESSAAGGYFNGSDAYVAVLYSTTPVQVIVGGSKKGEFSATGLAVTGALSATGAVSASGAELSLYNSAATDTTTDAWVNLIKRNSKGYALGIKGVGAASKITFNSDTNGAGSDLMTIDNGGSVVATGDTTIGGIGVAANRELSVATAGTHVARVNANANGVEAIQLMANGSAAQLNGIPAGQGGIYSGAGPITIAPAGTAAFKITTTGATTTGTFSVTGGVTLDNFTDWRTGGVVKGNIYTDASTMYVNSQATTTSIAAGGGAVNIGGEVALSSTLTLNNNNAFQLKDSGATPRRAFLWSGTDQIAFGDIDNAKAGSWTRFAANDYHAFYVNGAEKARLDSAGLLSITTGAVDVRKSTDGYFNALTLVNPSTGTSAVNRLQIGNNGSDGAGQVLVYGANHATLPNVMDVNNASNAALRLLSNNAVVASVTAAGVAVTGAVSATGPIGYATGAGGTVTQTVSKSDTVTLNVSTGVITTDAAALNTATIVSFPFNNNKVAADDMLLCTHHSGGTIAAYTINCRATGAGTAEVSIRNNTAGSLSEALTIKFALIKSSTS